MQPAKHRTYREMATMVRGADHFLHECFFTGSSTSSFEGSSHLHSRYQSFLDAFGDMTLRICSEPTVFENYVNEIEVDDERIELSLWDTA